MWRAWCHLVDLRFVTHSQTSPSGRSHSSDIDSSKNHIKIRHIDHQNVETKSPPKISWCYHWLTIIDNHWQSLKSNDECIEILKKCLKWDKISFSYKDLLVSNSSYKPSIKTWIFFVFSTSVIFDTRGFHKFLYRNIERVFNLLRQRSRGNILNSLLLNKLYTRHTNNIRPEQFTTGPLLFNFWVFFEILLFF